MAAAAITIFIIYKHGWPGGLSNQIGYHENEKNNRYLDIGRVSP